MKFLKLLGNLDKTQEYPLSRLYGYNRQPNGTYRIVQAEANIIKKVITDIAESNTSIDTVLDKLVIELSNQRNRSDRRWTKNNLLSLCRIIYSGYTKNDFGTLVESKYYESIVPLEICKKAVRKVKKYQKEGQ